MNDQLVTSPPPRQIAPPPAETKPHAPHRAHGGRRWLAAGALLVLGTVIAIAWWSMRGTETVHYVTVPASRGAITRTVTSTGTVNPELTIIVGSYVSGVIQSLSCDFNTQVKAGQVCAKIDPGPYQATLDQYSGQLLRDQANLDRDRMDLARYRKLTAEDSIARQQAEDQLYAVNQDEGTVKIDQALVEGAKLNLGYTDIVSPVDGTVVSRNVTQGQTVAASFQTPTLFLIATDLTKMQVDTNVSESDIGGIKEGNTATFTVDAFPKRTFEGTLTQVRQSPQTVQNVVTYDAVISTDNSDLALKPGMTASTRIIVDQRNDVMRVPNQALRYTPGGLPAAGTSGPTIPGGTNTTANGGGESTLWVLRDGHPVQLSVAVGLDDDNFTEIVKGDLRPDDQVIVSEQRDTGGAGSVPLPRL